MKDLKSRILQPSKILQGYVDCFRIIRYEDPSAFNIRVCPYSMPGMVFQQGDDGKSIIKKIITDKDYITDIPNLFIHGQITQLSEMYFAKGPYTSIQVLFKPQALYVLFAMDASKITNGSMQAKDFSGLHLNEQLLHARNDDERIRLLHDFLKGKLAQGKNPDSIIDESLSVIHDTIKTVTVGSLLGQIHLSERQFERRFMQVVGLPPQLYIRIKRFDEAMRLVDSGQYERLTDIATALHYYDQSHFIRDIKLFSGVTPKSISQKVGDFSHDKVVASYFQP